MRATWLILAGVLGWSPVATAQTVEVSAPLFPRVLELYPFEGDGYPATYEAQEALADEVLMSFAWVRDACAAHGYEIALEAGGPLTADERMDNYNQVAECAYDLFTAKPYLLPQLVLDVDLCALKLGPEWRLPTEADVLSWPAELFESVAEVLADTAGGTSFWGSFYFSLAVYVRGDEGELRIANLHPDATERVADLPAGTSLTHHVEGVPFNVGETTGWAPPVVRCVRETAATPEPEPVSEVPSAEE